ncbi:uncharacterized protein LOC103131869 [Tachysurus ichikawai]
MANAVGQEFSPSKTPNTETDPVPSGRVSKTADTEIAIRLNQETSDILMNTQDSITDDIVYTEQIFLSELPKVSQDSDTAFSSAVTSEKLQEALQSMECGRAPGIDGLQAELYKSFWNVIMEDLMEVLNSSLARGLLLYL